MRAPNESLSMVTKVHVVFDTILEAAHHREVLSIHQPRMQYACLAGQQDMAQQHRNRALKQFNFCDQGTVQKVSNATYLMHLLQQMKQSADSHCP